MKSVLDPNPHQELQQRLNQLTPESQRRWGKMDVAQMMAHVSNVLEIAVGDKKPPRSLLGYLLDRKSTRLNSSHLRLSRMPSSA